MDRPGPAFRRRLLLDALALLAADASEQIAWLTEHGVAADEIALDFDHAFGMAGALAGEGWLGRSVLRDLREIDGVLRAMSGTGNADRWERDAPAVDEGWDRVRRAARRVLVAELGDWRRPLPRITVIR
ncbi:hypothetical protein ACSNOK_20270 [Streptomyces sp. URMC 126]|uniref:hypothetical protein n=1 Tax=Streptomyces sp. URMC 126 TaxID=3423401 RepID=UPI003F1992CC